MSLQPTKNTPDFKVVNFNIDTNLARLEDGYALSAFPEWTIAARMPYIKEYLSTTVNAHQPDVVLIQEGRKTANKFGNVVDSVTPIVDHLSSLNYQVFAQQYNPSDKAFVYITAIKPGYTITSTKSSYFTAYPELPSDEEFTDTAARKAKNFGEEFEKSTFITTFHDSIGNEYQVYNVHKGLVDTHRLKASEMLLNWAKEYLSAETTGEIKKHIVMAGDFNSFGDRKGPEQLAILKSDNILQDSTESLKVYGTNQPIDTTYFAFPYDFAANSNRVYAKYNFFEEIAKLSPVDQKAMIIKIFKEECQATVGFNNTGSHLDHVFHYGFVKAQSYLMPTPMNGPGPEFIDEDSVKESILNKSQVGSAYISDHQPVLTVFGHIQDSNFAAELELHRDL